jgi:hypothetical protein
MCCACGGGNTEALAAPEWEVNLDYAQAEVYAADLGAAYDDLEQRMMRTWTDWQTDRDLVDQYYWNYELLPLLEEGAQLDERTLRTLITWIVDGTQIRGEPLRDVFPEVEEYMLQNYDATGYNLQEKFGMNTMPVVLQEEVPVTFSFYFDPEAVNAWFEKEGQAYDMLNRMYVAEWENYAETVTPLWQEIAQVNEEFDARFRSIDADLEVQLESSFNDIGAWLEDNFAAEEVQYVTLAAKVQTKRSNTDVMMYAAVAMASLAVVSVVLFKMTQKKDEKTIKNGQVVESLVNYT